MINGELIAVEESTPVSVLAYGVEGISANQTPAGQIAAIIVPQTFNAENGKSLIRIKIGNTDYYFIPEENTGFEEGKRYDYILTITNGEINGTYSVSEWLHTDDTEEE